MDGVVSIEYLDLRILEIRILHTTTEFKRDVPVFDRRDQKSGVVEVCCDQNRRLARGIPPSDQQIARSIPLPLE